VKLDYRYVPPPTRRAEDHQFVLTNIGPNGLQQIQATKTNPGIVAAAGSLTDAQVLTNQLLWVPSLEAKVHVDTSWMFADFIVKPNPEADFLMLVWAHSPPFVWQLVGWHPYVEEAPVPWSNFKSLYINGNFCTIPAEVSKDGREKAEAAEAG
jgi:hypothetical protein